MTREAWAEFTSAIKCGEVDLSAQETCGLSAV